MIKELEAGCFAFGVVGCPPGSVVAFDGVWSEVAPWKFQAKS